MFKKKEKINKQDVFDSLLLSFDFVDRNDNSFKYKLWTEGESKTHMFLTINNIDEIDDNYRPIKLFDESNNYSPLIPFFKAQIREEKVVSYILMLKEFLDKAKTIKIELKENGEKTYAKYSFYSNIGVTLKNDKGLYYTKNFEIILEFRESDVYPSVSKYIIDTASEAIYKKTL